ncbi:hypothetical protein [Pseudoduganella buxea]|uniref:Uncharacterized protein n=1 Tax=Pseudoduganella buxea TaxID=1949069 RepID=A0A6I3SZG8_9BURK|nr:hypothetical protein [Pseudoduganella buxea]MTV53642.1 hypothetical protein [Pseudoduganella buxea]GGB84001.1 hypothetical protein GCM10011572_02400 [Pseudoduganella buxea]
MKENPGETGREAGKPIGAGRWRDNGDGPRQNIGQNSGQNSGDNIGQNSGQDTGQGTGHGLVPGPARAQRRTTPRQRPASLPAMLFDGAMLLLALAYGVLQAAQSISQYDLERQVSAARIVRVSELAKTSTGTACALTPYVTETRMAGLNTERINRHLRDVHYFGDDPYWALVIATPAAVHLSTIARSKFDILGMHHLVPPQGQPATVERIKAQFPAGFVPAECAPLHRAVLVRISLPRGDYMLMGTLPD